jgi:hypothetical protein
MDPTDTGERRAAERRSASKRVSYAIAGVTAGEALAWNLSRAGACLNLGANQAVAPVGDLIQLTFLGVSLELQAKVVWVKSIGTFRRMGLAFQEMSDAQRAAIEELLRQG